MRIRKRGVHFVAKVFGFTLGAQGKLWFEKENPPPTIYRRR
jgi:hypothetical protein